LCAHVNIWARVQPEEKLAITKALQETEQLCLVTGGSVDDMAVLNLADVGVVLNSGQAVAKHAADVVLTDTSFMGVVSAMEEARQTSSTFQKAVMYLLGINVGELIGHALTLLAQLPKSFTCLDLLLGLAASTLGVFPLCWEPAEPCAIPSAPKSQGGSTLASARHRLIRILPMWLGLPLVMIATTCAGLSLHVGTFQNHGIASLCDYAWHPEAENLGLKARIRWRRDELPYHCRCPALESDQWGRQQSQQNNIYAEFSSVSGASGKALAKTQGPFKDGIDSVLEPCNGRAGIPSGGAVVYCWKASFLRPGQIVQSDGMNSASQEQRPVFHNILLHPEWNCARYGTGLVKSMAWFATILTQALFLQSARSPQPLLLVFWRNPKAVKSLFGVVAIALLAMYMPMVNDALHLAPLSASSLLVACLGPLGALGLAEASKIALRETTCTDLPDEMSC